MELKGLGLGINSVAKIKSNTSNKAKLNFKGADVVEFSSLTKERNAIIHDLKSIGLTSQKAIEFVKEYYGTDKYKELINGCDDEDFHYAAHFVDIDRNLTPSEAVIYQAFDMDDYYMQYSDGCMPSYYEKGMYKAEARDLGRAEFLPLDLAKTMLQGFDIAVSGMILKNNITKEEAEQAKKYYDFMWGNYKQLSNAKQAEYNIDNILKNTDRLNNLTDSKNYSKAGTIRPLTVEEAASFLSHELLDDTSKINKYIQLNERFGYNIDDIIIYNLWDKSIEEPQEQTETASNVLNLKTKQHFIDLQDKIEFLIKRDNGKHTEFYESLKLLDSRKFFERLSIKAMRFDAMFSFQFDKNLMQKNIQVLNSMSDELLDKITKNQDGTNGKFASLSMFFKTPDFDKKVADMEKIISDSPRIFEAMSKEKVLDFLTSSSFYSDTARTLEEFMAEIYGTSKIEHDADIIDFPNKPNE